MILMSCPCQRVLLLGVPGLLALLELLGRLGMLGLAFMKCLRLVLLRLQVHLGAQLSHQVHQEKRLALVQGLEQLNLQPKLKEP
jgi:hypothetical protein